MTYLFCVEWPEKQNLFDGFEQALSLNIGLRVYNLKCKDKKRVMDLDSRREMIIFELILTTFEVSTIFWGIWGSSGNQLEPTKYKL